MSLFLLQAYRGASYFPEMSSKIGVLFLLAISAFASTGAHAAPSVRASWGEWEAAKTLFDAGKFDEAIQEFKAHFKDEFTFYYNVGTAFYRQGQVGSAVAYLEKANRIHPHDPDVQFNLSVARSALSMNIGPDRLDPASSWIEQLADRVSLDEVRATLGLLGLIVVALWIQAYLKCRNVPKAVINPAGLIGIFAFSITVGIYAIQRGAESCPPAVCLQKEAIRSGPGEHYMELGFAETGSKLRLLGPSATDSGKETSEIWRQVRFSSHDVGWVKASSLLTL